MLTAKLSDAPMIEVHWVDSYASAGWESPDDKHQMSIRSLGWLIWEDDDTVALTTSITPDGRILDRLQIPKVAIVGRWRFV